MVENRKKPNHPSHIHPLTKTDTREIYPVYRARWHCDACGSVYDGMKDTGIAIDGESDEPDTRHAYHCSLCDYDICTLCFKGRPHPFHPHRLKKALCEQLYPQTDGQWRCDACKRVFNELTEGDCFTCLDCQQDLCKKCYKGEWEHVLHIRDHKLMPVHPEIKYRYYHDWSCDNCLKVFNFSNTPELFFHCSLCEYDLCPDCFAGTKHHLHQHNLVEVTMSQLRSYCSHCGDAIREHRAHVCRDPSCDFRLCSKCYNSKPKVHPYHPRHPLELCDARETYPQTGGLWHCDRCTSTNPYKEPSPIDPKEPMYHCEECQFDLCQRCYRKGLRPEPHSSATAEVSPTEARDQESSYQQYRMRHYTAERPVTGMQPLTYLHHPLRPPERMCLICNRSPAKYTFSHRGQTHYEYNSKVCCYNCACDTVNYQHRCPVCNMVPDGIVSSSDYNIM